jgi:hypothetical protein
MKADVANPPTPRRRLPWTKAERLGMLLALAIVVAFGLLTVRRTAWRWTPMTDFTVYLRAGWAVREGTSPYQVTNAQGWHYIYPPLFAILVAPLADPPDLPTTHEEAYRGLAAENLKLTCIVASWYMVSVILLMLALHWLAAAVEEKLPPPRDRAQARKRWWYWRLTPLLVCLPSILITLSRGQVELLILFCLAGAIAALLRGRQYQAGLWLALPICIKIIPAALLLYPLWRGQWRCLAGCAAGLLIGLVAIPVAALGPQTAWTYNKEFARVMLLPALGLGGALDSSRAHEIIEMNSTDNVSLLNVVYNMTHWPSLKPGERTLATPPIRMAALALAAAMVVITLAAAGRRREDSPAALMLFLGLLIFVMLVGNPVCHRHYFTLLIPLGLGLAVAHDFGVRHTRRGTVALIGFSQALLLVGLCSLPDFRDLGNFWGVSLIGVLPLWSLGVAALWRCGRAPTTPSGGNANLPHGHTVPDQ